MQLVGIIEEDIGCRRLDAFITVGSAVIDSAEQCRHAEVAALIKFQLIEVNSWSLQMLDQLKNIFSHETQCQGRIGAMFYSR